MNFAIRSSQFSFNHFTLLVLVNCCPVLIEFLKFGLILCLNSCTICIIETWFFLFFLTCFDQQYRNTGMKTENVEKFSLVMIFIDNFAKINKSPAKNFLKTYWICSMPDRNWLELSVCIISCDITDSVF